MQRYGWLLIFFIGWLSGCALPVRTQGTAGPVTWTASAFELSSGCALAGATDRFSFTFVLQETQGLELTFNTITWEVWQNGVDLSNRQTRTGSWLLPAHGTLQQPFVYRIFCPPGDDCPDVGPTTQWDITFEGTDAKGRTVRIAVQPELPWIPPKSTHAPPGLKQSPPVELPSIDFTVPRLYFPRIEND